MEWVPAWGLALGRVGSEQTSLPGRDVLYIVSLGRKEWILQTGPSCFHTGLNKASLWLSLVVDFFIGKFKNMRPLFRWGPDSYVGSHCARFAPPLPLLCCALLLRRPRAVAWLSDSARPVLTSLGESTLAQREGAPGSVALQKQQWQTQDMKSAVSKTKKRPKTFVVSVPLWTVRCGQRRKLSRLRKQSARRNQSISSKQNKWKNAADGLPFISQRATSLQRLGKSANSQTGFYDCINMVGGKLLILTIRNVMVSCNTLSQRSVWMAGEYEKAQPVEMTAEWCGNILEYF